MKVVLRRPFVETMTPHLETGRDEGCGWFLAVQAGLDLSLSHGWGLAISLPGMNFW